MSANEYEAIRSDGARFFVAPSDEHVWPDVEVVTDRADHYWVVEKIGHAGAMAREVDPRSEVSRRESMTETATWHSPRAGVHHDNKGCAASRRIKPRDLRSGTGGRPFCPNCKRLAA